MQSAQEVGRAHGRDSDWVPDNIEEAVEELESIGEGSPVDNVYEIISRVTTVQSRNPLAPRAVRWGITAT